LIQRCWNASPALRPTFDDIMEDLASLQTQDGAYCPNEPNASDQLSDSSLSLPTMHPTGTGQSTS
jgi:hypothetical protein